MQRQRMKLAHQVTQGGVDLLVALDAVEPLELLADQHGLEMPMKKVENFTRHLRLPSDCGPYWHNTG